MTTVSKSLVVFTIAASLAFMGFAAATRQGGPNYQAQLNDPILKDYVFESATDANTGQTTYSVKKRRPDQPGEGGQMTQQVLASNVPVLADAIIKARTNLRAAQQAERQELTGEIEGFEEGGRRVPGLRQRIERARAEIAQDIEAMTRREAQLVDELQRLQEVIGRLTEAAQNETNTALQLRTLATRRREDVFRLTSQLKELQTDKYAAEAQREKLDDLLTRVQSQVDRLQRRNEQLEYE